MLPPVARRRSVGVGHLKRDPVVVDLEDVLRGVSRVPRSASSPSPCSCSSSSRSSVGSPVDLLLLRIWGDEEYRVLDTGSDVESRCEEEPASEVASAAPVPVSVAGVRGGKAGAGGSGDATGVRSSSCSSSAEEASTSSASRYHFRLLVQRFQPS